MQMPVTALVLTASSAAKNCMLLPNTTPLAAASVPTKRSVRWLL